MKDVSVKVNGKEVFLKKEENLFLSLKEFGYEVPSLCCHVDIKKEEGCRFCLLEIDGEVVDPCSLEAEEGMDIVTDSLRIETERKNALKKILEKHALKCIDCVYFQKCKLLELAKKYSLLPGATQEQSHTFQVGPLFFDQSKCIGCRNCTSVCPVNFLEINEKGRVQPVGGVDCTSCGQCITHCPVGAIQGEGEFEELKDLEEMMKKKTVVVQFAPSIRTSIGEEFGMEPGSITTGNLVSALKKSGFHYVFDTATGADFTTTEEAEELLERLEKNENLPAMSSCCPAWVKFLEFNYPQFIPNLCTSRSPQTMLGVIIKEYWSEKQQINPDDIFVVSVMPCVAKKGEIKREELKINGRYPVDMVITTREAARLFKTKNISFNEEAETDIPFGSPSGAGVIYGSSGGVFESALRTAYFKATGEEIGDVLEIRGAEGIKKKEIKIGDKVIRVCVVSGICNAVKALQEIKDNKEAFHALEVMACPGGCVGGGGQPVPTTKEIISKRSSALYDIDKNNKTRSAHENKEVIDVYEHFFSDPQKRKELLHTRYFPGKITKIIKNEK